MWTVWAHVQGEAVRLFARRDWPLGSKNSEEAPMTKCQHSTFITYNASVELHRRDDYGPKVLISSADGRRKCAVRLACARPGCRAYRFAYFLTSGELAHLGPIRLEPK